MRKDSIIIIRMCKRIILFITFCLLVNGCVFSRNLLLPKVSYDQIVPQQTKPSVDYTIRIIFGEEKKEFPTTIRDQEKIEGVLSKSKMFSAINYGKGSAEYYLSFTFHTNPYDSKGERYLNYLWGAVSGLSLLIIPVYDAQTFLLNVDVKKGDLILKQYSYKERIGGFIWGIPGLIAAIPKIYMAGGDIAENKLLNFLVDLQKDKILDVSSQ